MDRFPRRAGEMEGGWELHTVSSFHLGLILVGDFSFQAKLILFLWRNITYLNQGSA